MLYSFSNIVILMVINYFQKCKIHAITSFVTQRAQLPFLYPDYGIPLHVIWKMNWGWVSQTQYSTVFWKPHRLKYVHGTRPNSICQTEGGGNHSSAPHAAPDSEWMLTGQSRASGVLCVMRAKQTNRKFMFPCWSVWAAVCSRCPTDLQSLQLFRPDKHLLLFKA